MTHENFQIELSRVLGGTALFSGLSSNALDELAANARRIEIRKGQTICDVGCWPESVFVTLSGLIKRTSVSIGGQEKVQELISSGHVFGEAELFAGRPYAVNTVAVEACILLSLNGATVRRVMEQEPRLAVRLVARLANRQLEMEAEVATSLSKTGCERVLDYLLQMVGDRLPATGETRLQLVSSKQLIASRIGLTPESLSRALRDLTNAGLMVVNGRNLRLINEKIARHLAVPNSKNMERRVLPRPRVVPQRPNFGSIVSIVNIAGHQRMLSQRMAKSWLMIGGNISPGRARSMLAQSIALFENQRTIINSHTLSDAAKAACRDVDAVWAPYKDLLDQPPEQRGGRRVFAANESVLTATDHLAQMLADAGGDITAYRVNLAGRQRMLAQRMAKFYMFKHWNIYAKASRTGIEQARREFDVAHQKLCEVTAGQKTIHTQLKETVLLWQALQAALDRPGSGNAERDATDVAVASERLVEQMDVIVTQLEQVAKLA